MNYMYYKIKESFHEIELPLVDTTVIPKRIFQTYSDISRIPSEIYKNIKQFAPEYQHDILDNKAAETVLHSYFQPSVLHTFLHLHHGAHKADLLRYALLYIHGGIYLDIKTELINPVSQLFNQPCLYTVLSKNGDHVYQGIIASPPRNPFFMDLINHMVKTGNPLDYHIFCKEFKIQMESQLEKDKYILFEERCSNDASMCYDGLDRYGLCCFVYHHGEPIIKTRRSSYPW